MGTKRAREWELHVSRVYGVEAVGERMDPDKGWLTTTLRAQQIEDILVRADKAGWITAKEQE